MSLSTLDPNHQKFFTGSKYHVLETTERVASVFSILGTSFIFVTFLASTSFRKPVNRLIFYASWGNTLMNIATLISIDGINAGKDSSLCQSQAFLVQMFLPADALWNLAVAINVYLTVFRKYNATQLRSLEWRYMLICYGGPFLTAFVFCFITTAGRGKIYGPAELWCWISLEWDFLRIALCYAPAWLCILISFSIYLMAGVEIFRRRGQLRSFKDQKSDNHSAGDPYTNTKTTEIEIFSELANLSSSYGPRPLLSKIGMTDGSMPNSGYEPYSIKIERGSLKHQALPRTPSAPSFPHRSANAALEANTAAKAYTKCAMLFFVSLLITWVPSSINRVYALIHPDVPSFSTNHAASLVLPLMGFWNTIIYVYTSWGACKALFSYRGRPFSQMRWPGSMGRARMLESRDSVNQASMPSRNSRDSIPESTRRFAV